MQFPKRETRHRHGDGLLNCVRLGSLNSSEDSHKAPIPQEIASSWIARRYGLLPHVAALIASLAFEGRAQ